MGKIGAAAGIAAFVPRMVAAQAPQAPAGAPAPAPNAARGVPLSVISSPPRDFTPGAGPVSYPDPDVITIDPADSKVVYVTFGGYERDNVWKTEDDGKRWKNIGLWVWPEASHRL
jgi:gluconolactonase